MSELNLLVQTLNCSCDQYRNILQLFTITADPKPKLAHPKFFKPFNALYWSSLKSHS